MDEQLAEVRARLLKLSKLTKVQSIVVEARQCLWVGFSKCLLPQLETLYV